MRATLFALTAAAFAALATPAAAQELKDEKSRSEEELKKRQEDPNYGVTYSTKLDFDSTLIEGRMKAPAGFFLQGRTNQSLNNLVKLRSNFKTELRNSRAAVKATVR